MKNTILGVRGFVNQQTMQLHDEVVKALLGPSANRENAEKLPGPTLYNPGDPETEQKRWVEKILQHHTAREPKVSWQNFDATLLSKSHVEMSKMFCASLGEHPTAIEKKTLDDVDGAALFAMMIHCDCMHNKSVDPACARAATAARNLWAHEGPTQNLRLTEEQYEKCLRDCEQLLSDHLGLQANPDAQRALESITAIRDKDMTIATISKDEMAQIYDMLTEVPDLDDDVQQKAADLEY